MDTIAANWDAMLLADRLTHLRTVLTFMTDNRGVCGRRIDC